MSVGLIISIIIGLWLLLISGLVFFIFNYFQKLSKQVKRGNLIKVLDKLIESERKNSKAVLQIKKELKRIDQKGLLHVQKVSLTRFNPFKELGGDHSFILVLLDGNDDGVVLTGLHTRERTRMYMKEVKGGKCKFELSGEEKRALTKAQKGK